MNTSEQPRIESIEIIYDDEYIIAVNKPNNYLIHNSHYARNIQEPTLIDVLTEQLGYSPYPLHRLDRKTSGVIILAKDKSYISSFQPLFQEEAISKTYCAVVRGFTEPQGSVDTPVKNDDTGVYKDALTHYETLQRIELDIPVHPYPKSRYGLVKLMPQTGRMHQLRKHMNKISHPIIGDYKYGDRFHNRNFEDNFDWHYMFLHAYSVEFEHPLSYQQLCLKASFPKDWLSLFDEFGWTAD